MSNNPKGEYCNACFYMADFACMKYVGPGPLRFDFKANSFLRIDQCIEENGDKIDCDDLKAKGADRFEFSKEREINFQKRLHGKRLAITRVVPVTIPIFADNSMCTLDCPFTEFRSAADIKCKRYDVKIISDRCPECLAEFGTGAENGNN